MKDQIWLAGRYETSKPWEVLGVYRTKKEAIERCTREYDFVTAFKVGESLPEERQPMPICIYPFHSLDPQPVPSKEDYQS